MTSPTAAERAASMFKTHWTGFDGERGATYRQGPTEEEVAAALTAHGAACAAAVVANREHVQYLQKRVDDVSAERDSARAECERLYRDAGKICNERDSFVTRLAAAEAERDAAKRRIVSLEQSNALFEKNSEDAVEMWELLRWIEMYVGFAHEGKCTGETMEVVTCPACKAKEAIAAILHRETPEPKETKMPERCPSRFQIYPTGGVRCCKLAGHTEEHHESSVGDDGSHRWVEVDGKPVRVMFPCRGCGRLLLPENRDSIADGCPCNSVRGVNHGLVPVRTCTCPTCDPAQTGSVRKFVSPSGGESASEARVCDDHNFAGKLGGKCIRCGLTAREIADRCDVQGSLGEMSAPAKAGDSQERTAGVATCRSAMLQPGGGPDSEGTAAALEAKATPAPLPDPDRGKVVRDAWVSRKLQQGREHPHYMTPWAAMTQFDRDTDNAIYDAVIASHQAVATPLPEPTDPDAELLAHFDEDRPTAAEVVAPLLQSMREKLADIKLSPHPAVALLTELVECKRLKAKIEELENQPYRQVMHELRSVDADYRRREPAAWSAAIAFLEPKEPHP